MSTLNALDEKNGFRDLTLGQLYEGLEGFVELGPMDDAGFVLYKRPSDSLRIGEADLTGINYVFYRGSLFSITLYVGEYQEFMRLGEVLFTAYGSPGGIKPGEDSYLWTGTKAQLFLLWQPEEESGFALFTSLPLEEQAKLDRISDANRGVSDL